MIFHTECSQSFLLGSKLESDWLQSRPFCHKIVDCKKYFVIVVELTLSSALCILCTGIIGF